MLTEKELKDIISISKLNYNNEDFKNIFKDINNTINMVEKINSIDTSDHDIAVKKIKEHNSKIFSNTMTENDFYEDTNKKGLSKDEIMKVSKLTSDGFFTVPKVIK